MQNKKTVILGASNNPYRYAFSVAMRLKHSGYEFVPVGIKKGQVEGVEILDLRKKPKIENVDTITLYMNRQNQSEWEEYILSLNPVRIIFNPGAENIDLAKKAKQSNIEVLNACTLVMLASNSY